MSIALTCPGCGFKGAVPTAKAGGKVKCNTCGAIIDVPRPTEQDRDAARAGETPADRPTVQSLHARPTRLGSRAERPTVQSLHSRPTVQSLPPGVAPAALQRITIAPGTAPDHAVHAAVACLRSGGLVVAPTDTTYGLLADAEQLVAYQRVFAVKQRPLDQPLPYLLADTAQVEAFLAASLTAPVAAAAAAFWPGPLTLVLRATDAVLPHLVDSRGTVGVRVPDHAFVRAVAEGVGGPLTGTSANRSGQPPATTARDAELQLRELVDCLVDGGVAVGTPSTIIDTTCSPWRVLRPGPVSAAQVAAAAGVSVEED